MENYLLPVAHCDQCEGPKCVSHHSGHQLIVPLDLDVNKLCLLEL